MRLEDVLPALRAGRRVTLYGRPVTPYGEPRFVVNLPEILSDGWEIKPEPMTWLEACEAMFVGKKVRRQIWLDYMFLRAPTDDIGVVPSEWREATDWVVVE